MQLTSRHRNANLHLNCFVLDDQLEHSSNDYGEIVDVQVGAKRFGRGLRFPAIYLDEFGVDLLQQGRLLALEEAPQRRPHEEVERAQQRNGRRADGRIGRRQSLLGRFDQRLRLHPESQIKKENHIHNCRLDDRNRD